MYNELIINKYIAPNENEALPTAKPKPTVHKGGIKAVAIATPNITGDIVPFLVLATIKDNPPKKAINTSLISGSVLDNNSEDSSLRGKNEKNKYAVKTLKTTITEKLIIDFLRVSKSLIAIDKPKPKIGPIKGEISIAPITTGIELAFKPTDATKIEQIRIQAFGPLIDMSAFIEFIVWSLSASFLKSRTSLKKENKD